MKVSCWVLLGAACVLGCASQPDTVRLCYDPAAKAASPEQPAAPAGTVAAAPPATAQQAIAAPKEPEKPSRFGRAMALAEERPLWDAPSVAPAPVAAPQRYEAWREKRRVRVGQSHLSIAEMSSDGRYLLAVSENEARLRVYDGTTLAPVSNVAVQGYAQFGRGDFTWWPGAGSPPPVVFAGDAGTFLVDPKSGEPLQQLSELGAWDLRWSDDGVVLGANLSNVDTQTSVIAFHVLHEGRLEPGLMLSFAERVDGWDLSSDRRRLAVTYYPSGTVEFLDLADRAVLWTAPAPQYGGGLDISPDDTRIAVGGAHAVVFDAANPERAATFTDFGNNIHRVRFAPSGDALAVSSYDGRVRILSADPGEGTLRLRKMLRHDGTANVYAIQFIDGGAGLLSSSGDQTVRIWGP